MAQQSLDPQVIDVEPQATPNGGALRPAPRHALAGGAAAAAPARGGVSPAWIAGGLLAAVAIAAGAYMAGRSSPAAPVDPVAATAEAPTRAGVSRANTAATAGGPSARGDGAGPSGAAPVCADCGVVESVAAVQRKGEGSGAGAAAGGVVGGLVGNQFGKGDGRTAMTVLGVVGGAVAGHEIEKQARATTVYRVKVRTETGELRTVEQAQAPAVGSRVRIRGNKLEALPA